MTDTDSDTEHKETEKKKSSNDRWLHNTEIDGECGIISRLMRRGWVQITPSGCRRKD